MTDDCESCGRSMMGRYRELSGRDECESCERDFWALYGTDKLNWSEMDTRAVKLWSEDA
mgnify:FL=1